MAGIYIHIPFCKQACHYCDFHFTTSQKHKQAMMAAICSEIQLRKEELKEPVETIYFGGGTPSLLHIDEIQILLNTVYECFKVVGKPEITLEANPDDLTEDKIAALAKSPVNRLSIGIQSFVDEDLKMMNRSHSAIESLECLSVATRYFENITIDLIYGIPNMSTAVWRQNLQKAFTLGIPHVSSYALTVEPKTALDSFIQKGTYPPLDESLAARHFDILVAETAKNGFVHYETSNFGKEAFFSKHNTSYWQGKPYVGVGPSAHSFNGYQRSWNVSNNVKYIKSLNAGILPSEKEELSKQDRFNETIMTGLRTIWGVDLDTIQSEFGTEYYHRLLKESEKFIGQGLLIISNDSLEGDPIDKLKTTPKGKFLADGIASDLFQLD